MQKQFALIVVGLAFAVPSFAESDSDMSFDGLYRRPSNVFNQLWVRKEFDIHEYHKVKFAPSFIEYRPLKYRAETDPNAPKALTPTKRQQESLEQTVNAAFREELAKSKYFQLVDESGADVLTVRGDLLDVVSYVPANAGGENEALTLPVAGEAILVLELYDSRSNAIMVRASERITAKRVAETETADDAVRATARAWAATLRERLDAAASIPRSSPVQ